MSPLRICLGLLVLWLIAVMIYQTHKPLPEGVSYESPVYRTSQVTFLQDLTYPNGAGGTAQKQQIYNRILHIVDEAESFIVIDLFLFNDYIHEGQTFPQVSAGLANRLTEKKKTHPDMDIVFITDEINTNYNSAPNPLLERMKKAGIRVVITDVDPLRDSTPAYSAVWRTFFQWFGQSGNGWIPNLMSSQGPDITMRSYLKLMNVKANHRKVVASEKSALISSGNVHDASAFHSNIAFEVHGEVIGDILKAEQAVLDFSGGGQLPAYSSEPAAATASGAYQIRYVTEGKVYDRVLEAIHGAGSGDQIDMGMFYLADRKVIEGLLEASERGAAIRVLLDPNENAFGQDKIGIPNRPVASELHSKSNGRIAVKWYNTTEEQYHTKLLYVRHHGGDSIMMGGSTNFTPRNLNNYNLENDLWVQAPSGSELDQNLEHYFDRLWNNKGAEFSLELPAYQEKTNFLKDWAYRLQTILGFTTF
ncbi:phospholipase D family protein [Paenibacillus sp. JX-17]|uniref:Phospholipase D family protein n=1 Tax=Paenibacillus lacisoli TaxID=3064525 RepID=A0ABT9CEV8_9BACL|nr:phospholipase D family protein [Paenibacillus sp. JX-17]MDO7906492.1 phospholipase D family protein [Paenibacillus sp. JX-17]